MAFVQVDDGHDMIEVIVFPSVLKQNPDIWQENNMILLEGKLNDRDDELKISCENVNILNEDLVATWQAANSMRQDLKINNEQDQTIEKKDSNIYIKIPQNSNPALFNSLKEIFQSNQGNSAVYLKIPEQNGLEKEVKTSFKIDFNSALENKIIMEISNSID
jgi:DNA polymerase-3 subunit alpha